MAGLGRHLTVCVCLLLLLPLAALDLVRAGPELDVTLGLCGTIVQPWGYPCTEYTVQTEDGYLLAVQNIPYGASGQPSSGARRPPVLIQHGLFGGGDNFLSNQPSESLGYILADSGFDVWIGNIRCIGWSHGHVNLTTDDAEFWDWTWDELAAYDLPAMLGFVHNQTESKVLYIGHSQGTSMLMAGLVGTAQSEHMTEMLAGNVLLCPIAFMNDITSTFAKVAADLYVDKVWNTFGVQEFSLVNEVGHILIETVCGTSGVNCTDLFRAVTGNDCCVNETRMPYYLNFLQPTSTNNMDHFAQMIRTNKFSMYDYGLSGNVEHYNQITPPDYVVANLPTSVPLLVAYGGQDSLADPGNVQALLSVLGSKVTKVVYQQDYAHIDFVTSPRANVDVYPQIIKFLWDLSS